jgi:predicted dehydrogenase
MGEIKSVAVVGLNIGRSHIAEAYAPRPERWRLAAVCDRNQERLDAVANEFSAENRTLHFDELLARDDIDVIDIATPPATHFELVSRALAAGKHVV